MNKITRAEAWQRINETNGRIFSAEVIKRSDGSLRQFTCRLSHTVSVGKVGGDLRYDPSEHALVGIYEMAGDERDSSDKYRMLNILGLKTLSVDGDKYVVEG